MTDLATNGLTASSEYLRPWVIEWRGSRLAASDVTVAQYSLAVILAADSWELDPRRSPTNLVAWVIVAVCSATGRDVDEVQAELADAPMAELLGAVTTAG
jgi:hypothetical protein